MYFHISKHVFSDIIYYKTYKYEKREEIFFFEGQVMNQRGEKQRCLVSYQQLLDDTELIVDKVVLINKDP